MSNEYPAFFFHKHHGRKKVLSQEQRDALGPEWADSPTKTDETFAAARNGANDPETPLAPPPPPPDPATLGDPGPPTEPQDDPGTPPAESPATDPAVQEEQEKAAIWSTPVGVIVESLAQVPRDVLERIKSFEEANPKGARVTVIRAIDKALEALEPETPPAEGGAGDAEAPPPQE